MTIWENAQFWFNILQNADYGHHGEAMIRFDCDGIRHVLTILPGEERSSQGFTVRFNLMNNFDFLVTFKTDYVPSHRMVCNSYYCELPEFNETPRLRLTNENINTMEDVEHIMVIGIIREVFNHVSV